MNDESDLHEPEHDHLLDHEFYEEFTHGETEVSPLYDDDEEDDASGMLDDDE